MSFTHTQSNSSATWTVNHNLGEYPNVEVRANNGRVVFPDAIQHVNANTLLIKFTSPQVGSVKVVGKDIVKVREYPASGY